MLYTVGKTEEKIDLLTQQVLVVQKHNGESIGDGFMDDKSHDVVHFAPFCLFLGIFLEILFSSRLQLFKSIKFMQKKYWGHYRNRQMTATAYFAIILIFLKQTFYSNFQLIKSIKFYV